MTFVPGKAPQGPAWFQSPLLFDPEANSCGTKKRMKSSIEGLTLNSA